MGQVIRLAIIGFVIQFIGMASFMSVAQTATHEPGKKITMSLFFIATLILLIVAVFRLNLIKLLLLALLLAVSFLCAWYLLGLTLFPGLLMKILPLSIQDLSGFPRQLVFNFGAIWHPF